MTKNPDVKEYNKVPIPANQGSIRRHKRQIQHNIDIERKYDNIGLKNSPRADCKKVKGVFPNGSFSI